MAGAPEPGWMAARTGSHGSPGLRALAAARAGSAGRDEAALEAERLLGEEARALIARQHADPLRSHLSTPETAGGENKQSARDTASQLPLPSARSCAAGLTLPSPRGSAAELTLPSDSDGAEPPTPPPPPPPPPPPAPREPEPDVPLSERFPPVRKGPRFAGPGWWHQAVFPPRREPAPCPLGRPGFEARPCFQPRYEASPCSAVFLPAGA
eukprot:TRINITY_DN2762_c0_g1_i1.p2 TRINITY_DN2762_c0_g1~~TRINITY_DN2762_c0_g1_i1.p2  ORF type:complete len:234 (+),score=59.83 TRINITY_DN2762_c0_g1_i1:72-704(+)